MHLSPESIVRLNRSDLEKLVWDVIVDDYEGYVGAPNASPLPPVQWRWPDEQPSDVLGCISVSIDGYSPTPTGGWRYGRSISVQFDPRNRSASIAGTWARGCLQFKVNLKWKQHFAAFGWDVSLFDENGRPVT